MLSKDKRTFVKVPSSDLVVGDIVKCYADEKFSADFALLTSSGGGDCFIKTSSLDGEKNLKKREFVKDLDKHIKKDVLDPDAYLGIKGHLKVELPNKDLHSFKGMMNIGTDEYPLSDSQLLLKGADLANTEWVVGICVYTG